MKVETIVIYPPTFGAQYRIPACQFSVDLNIGCSTWQEEESYGTDEIRKGFCDLLFAGCGNHPGDEAAEIEFGEFDSGDPGINRVHEQWAKQRIRSMSVGDVVVIDPHRNPSYFICDASGWLNVSSYQAISWLLYPRQYFGASHELREWKADNGLE